MTKESYVVGLMSGTSLDGIDAALVNILDTDSEIEVDLVHFSTIDYTPEIQAELLKLCHPDTANLSMISKMNMYLGDVFADAVEKVTHEAGIAKEDIRLVSSHGQTIYHQPDAEWIDGRAIISTFQIGDIGVIAEKTGITTVGDFRTRDMAARGQGAPLVPYADYMLFKKADAGRVLLNIGGIANMTVIPRGASESDVFAYDTGPGNMMIDAFAKWVTGGEETYDRDGRLARQGEINEEWLDELLAHEYFGRPSPKSTGRELFGEFYAKKLWEEAEAKGLAPTDRLATMTELTARTIADEIKRHVETQHLSDVLVSGGGRYNPFLMERIRVNLFALEVKPTDDVNMNANAKEAIVFALLGYQCYHKRTNNIPTATGAEHPVVMGKIAW